MVSNATDLLGWTNFPKGLRVLLLDGDSNSAAAIRSKLEQMDYLVSTFCNDSEALSAASNISKSYHVAIVEVSTCNRNGRFKFLETVKDLPTVMTSNVQCLHTMMKCIALGAVEFLIKPVSDDKLRNIWQHVVHKAFIAGEGDLSNSLRLVKNSVLCTLQLRSENGELGNPISDETGNLTLVHENDHNQSKGSDWYPASSNSDLKEVMLLDDGDFQDRTSHLAANGSGEHDGDFKSVETTCGNSVDEATVQASSPQRLGDTVIKLKDESTDKNECDKSHRRQNKGDTGNHIGESRLHNSCGTKASRKKAKVDWTPELHKKFVQAVDQLGVDHAIPSRILGVMKVEGLTRHNVASHLQKYRMHRRYILPKEEWRWSDPRDSLQRSYYPHKPILAFPPYHSNHTFLAGQVHPARGLPNSYSASVQLWGPTCYPAQQPTGSLHWKAALGMHADAWVCPLMQPPKCPFLSFAQVKACSNANNTSGFHCADVVHNSCSVPQIYFDHHPAEEVVDTAVKEAVSKPWLPLPLGLKPPSIDSVLTELSKQGISTIPPRVHTPPD